ncbi:MAG TPA: hypothetical protein VK034_13405 [Enhygromyxa sp.]|nr:hypothetical protein [Enhygromyxa sp.]
MKWTLPALMLMLLLACGRAGAPTHAPVVEPPTLEQLYVDKRYGELVLQAASLIEAEGGDRQQLAEARFFRALAWLAQDSHGKQSRALLELRKLEFEYPDLLWGRLAALQVAAATRAEVMQATLLELAIEHRDLQARIDELEQSLVELHAELGKRDGEIARLGRERSELTEQLAEAREQVAALTQRVQELEDELAALKQIDMQREP